MKKSDRWEKGLENFNALTGRNDNPFTELGDFGDMIMEVGFGDLYSREALSWRERQIITVAVLTALGREPQLKIHLQAALYVGLSFDELAEVILHTALYSGFPAAINATQVLNGVYQEYLEQNIERKKV